MKLKILLSKAKISFLCLLTTLVSLHAFASDGVGNVELFISPGSDRTLIGGQALMPIVKNDRSIAYLDFRGVLDPENTNEINMGVGYRRLLNNQE